MVENVGTGENIGYQHFLLLPKYFQISSPKMVVRGRKVERRPHNFKISKSCNNLFRSRCKINMFILKV